MNTNIDQNENDDYRKTMIMTDLIRSEDKLLYFIAYSQEKSQ
jgi:hypothetical protein